MGYHVNIIWLTALCVLFYFKWTLSIRLVPERTEVTYVNEKYLYNVSAFITRYGRKSTYYYHLHAGLKHTWGNNITMHLSFYELQNNQFRRTFVEFHLKLCDMLTRDQYFGKLIAVVLEKYGLTCPFKASMYRFSNVTLAPDNFPNILPFQKGKAEFIFTQLPTQDVVGSIYTIFNVKLH